MMVAIQCSHNKSDCRATQYGEHDRWRDILYRNSFDRYEQCVFYWYFHAIKSIIIHEFFKHYLLVIVEVNINKRFHLFLAINLNQQIL